NKSIHDISWLLNIPWSTVSGIITKWKQLGTTATQPEVAGHGSVHAVHTVHRSRQLSAESIAKDLQTSCGLQRASWNGFPWPSSCIQALHHQVQCKTLNTVG
ncbi:unnamed protein product, partial [Staurois parvus]